MTTLLVLLTVLFAAPAGVFMLYRVFLPLIALWRIPQSAAAATRSFSVGLVTVSHACNDTLQHKLVQFEQLQQAFTHTETPVVRLYIGLDGAPLPTRRGNSEQTFEWITSPVRVGKNRILADIVEQARTDVLVFTDVDAAVDQQALAALLEPLARAGIGAVTGRRQIQDNAEFAAGQTGYIAADDRIRVLEMKYLGSVTSSDGKLYAIRRRLIDSLPGDVTDDLFTALGAIASGQRLVFAPAAVAKIGRPARDVQHEITRRRRITTRGLSTLWRRRAIMNPFRTGGYGIALFINKGLRRLSGPGLLLSLLTATALLLRWLLPAHAVWLLVLLPLAGAVAWYASRHAALSYLLLGLTGMSLGVIDFLRGKRVTRWQPRKQLAGGGVDEQS